jgi:uncharacterized protein YbbC (DUF1343 family)
MSTTFASTTQDTLSLGGGGGAHTGVSPQGARTSVVLGSTRLLASGRLRGQRVGIVANPASIDHAYVHVVDRLAQDAGVTVGAIFGPQHGFHADVQDNMIETPHREDASRRVPIYSLYSETREPTAAMLDGLDVLVIDLQDVGTRVYTFVYTMANCLRGAARAGVPVIVCDRPNPIGGLGVEGPMLHRGFESFVGLFPIPLRHGMTIGELARLFNEAFGLGATLDVVSLDGWSRRTFWDETHLPWVMPSPNMPTLDTAIVYPGQVLFEGTQLSEARGTTRPFELVGAPWIDAARFAAGLNDYGLPGVYFRPTYFEPTFHKFAREACGGCQVHVTDRMTFRPVLAAAAMLRAFHAASPERFAWRQPPYEYEHEKMPIDILAGSSALREQIEAGVDPRAIAASWDDEVATFMKLRSQYLLYS